MSRLRGAYALRTSSARARPGRRQFPQGLVSAELPGRLARVGFGRAVRRATARRLHDNEHRPSHLAQHQPGRTATCASSRTPRLFADALVTFAQADCQRRRQRLTTRDGVSPVSVSSLTSIPPKPIRTAPNRTAPSSDHRSRPHQRASHAPERNVRFLKDRTDSFHGLGLSPERNQALRP